MNFGLKREAVEVRLCWFKRLKILIVEDEGTAPNGVVISARKDNGSFKTFSLRQN